MADSPLAELVRRVKTIAVVGMKDDSDPDAPAYAIPEYLQELGYEITPVNPTIDSSLGKRSLTSLAELETAPDLINVFRRPSALPALADEILALPPDRRPGAVWFQTGIAHAPTAERLRAAGIEVVEDRCLGVYASRYKQRP
jgi:predicted CoA-binding protein